MRGTIRMRVACAAFVICLWGCKRACLYASTHVLVSDVMRASFGLGSLSTAGPLWKKFNFVQFFLVVVLARDLVIIRTSRSVCAVCVSEETRARVS